MYSIEIVYFTSYAIVISVSLLTILHARRVEKAKLNTLIK